MQKHVHKFILVCQSSTSDNEMSTTESGINLQLRMHNH